MRLALVASERLPVLDPPGGPIPTYIGGIVPHLRTEFEVTVISATPPGNDQAATWPGVAHFPLPSPSLESYTEQVVELLRAEPPDIIHVLNRPGLARAIRTALPRMPIVLGLHNLFAPMPDSLLCQGLLVAQQIVTISHFVGREMERRCPAIAGHWRAVHSGVDPERFVPGWLPTGAALAADLRQREGLGNAPLVLFAGRHVASKGADLLLAAMAKVWRKMPAAVLVCAGGRTLADSDPGPYGVALREAAANAAGRVIFPGWLTPVELRAWFAAASLLVCPSQWPEPLARVLYEGMAAGLPLVVSDRGGNAEVVEDAGNGLLVADCENPAAYAEAVLRLLGDPDLRQRLGRQGRERVVARHGWERVAAELGQVYQVAAHPAR